MRREAASTRVVPRVALVPVGRGFFCGLVRGGPHWLPGTGLCRGGCTPSVSSRVVPRVALVPSRRGPHCVGVGFRVLGFGGTVMTPPPLPRNLQPNTQNPRSSGMRLNGSQILSTCLHAEGVEVIFGIP